MVAVAWRGSFLGLPRLALRRGRGWPAACGVMPAILGVGVGGGFGLVLGGLVDERLGWRWLLWVLLAAVVLAAVCTGRFIPGSGVRAPGRVSWLAVRLLTAGVSCLLVGVAQGTGWGWAGLRAVAVPGGGLLACAAWIAVGLRGSSPLAGMAVMRVRGCGR